MSTPTTNFGWLKPTVGGDNDIWGDYLDTNLDSQDTLVRNIINNFISPTAPSVAQAGTQWLDNTSNPYILKIYDGTDWIIMGYMNVSTNTFDAPSTTNYIGDYKISAQTANHGSWVLCNGQSLSTTTYSGLFALIGYSFGGSGATFIAPDLRTQVMGVIGSYAGNTTRALGDRVGEESHVLTIPELPSHNHSLSPFRTHDVLAQEAPGNNELDINATGASPNTANTGGGVAHNNMQPTLFSGNAFIFSGV